jgi:hypothetical protein
VARLQLLVGIFWPSIMKLRSQYVPEDIRATILNLFRVPLNLFVCLILYNVRAAATPPACSPSLLPVLPLPRCLHCTLQCVAATAVHPLHAHRPAVLPPPEEPALHVLSMEKEEVQP